jgi:hypothetical protein
MSKISLKLELALELLMEVLQISQEDLRKLCVGAELMSSHFNKSASPLYKLCTSLTGSQTSAQVYSTYEILLRNKAKARRTLSPRRLTHL